FFSSRRRHTRWPRDWSSDVCSSDLKTRQAMVRLTEMFTAGEADKTYLALAKGRFQKESGSIDLRLAERQQTFTSKQQRGVNMQRSEERRVGKEGRSWRGAKHVKRRE